MVKTLDVGLIPQKTELWCWAASAEMIMSFEGRDVSQEDQAGNVVKDGWPDFGHWGFTCTLTPWGTALTFDNIVQQIESNIPVAFALWMEGAAHMMVARGYNDSNRMVYVNDPAPVNKGDTRWITYDEYVSGANHLVDYYDIRSV
jgi:uncharacterized protein YvpB